MHAGEERQSLGVVALVDGELVVVVEAEVSGGVVAPAGGVDQGLGQIGFADAGFAEDDQIVGAVDPPARGEAFDQVTVEVSPVEVVDVFDAGGRVRCAGGFEQLEHSPLGAGGRLLLQGVPDFLGETPLIAGGSLAMSMTASPNAVIRSAVNSGMSSTLRCWSFIAGLPPRRHRHHRQCVDHWW